MAIYNQVLTHLCDKLACPLVLSSRIKRLASMEKNIHECVVKAIQEVGIENFKKTSLFLSNEMRKKQLDKAA